jgi:hypothetical protein
LFHIDVAKVDWGCCTCCICCKCFRDILEVFKRFLQNVSFVPDVCCKCFGLDVGYVSHIYCNNMFQMFQLFQSYIAVSVLMLQVASGLSGCCICFIHTLEVYVPDVSSISYVCCIQVFHVSHLSCCSESQGERRVMVARRGHRGMGRGELGPADRAHYASVSYRRGTMGTRCECGVGRTASNRGGYGGLCVRGESSRHTRAMTGWGAHAGQEKSADGGSLCGCSAWIVDILYV